MNRTSDLPDAGKGIRGFLTRRLPWLRRRARIRQYLDDLWAGRSSKPVDFELIEIYHRFQDPAGESVDDHTWKDLDLKAVFQKLDRTAGAPGAQYLYHRLRSHGNGDSPVYSDDRFGQWLSGHPDLRRKIQRILFRLRHDAAHYIPYLLYGDLAVNTAWTIPFLLLGLLSLSSIVLTFFFFQCILAALFFSLVNMIIHTRYAGKIYEHFSSLSSFNQLLRSARELADLKGVDGTEEIAALRARRELIVRMQSRIGWAVVDKNALDDIARSFLEYFNQFCLLDLVLFLTSVKNIRKHQAAFRDIHERLGRLDARMAIASYREEARYFTRAGFTDEKKLSLAGAVHPLLDHPVPNDLDLRNQSALITGSNMAGKTTLLRTVGVNFILGHSLGFCLADRALLPRMGIRTLIEREDDITTGKSYYFVEVERIRSFTGTDEKGCLLLVDEMYRGTNSVERIAASAAVLNFIGRQNIVLATTHDAELQERVSDRYRGYHFSESIREGQCCFDYKLKAGSSGERNAIRFLQVCDYPSDIIREARRLADELEPKFGSN